MLKKNKTREIFEINFGKFKNKQAWFQWTYFWIFSIDIVEFSVSILENIELSLADVKNETSYKGTPIFNAQLNHDEYCEKLIFSNWTSFLFSLSYIKKVMESFKILPIGFLTFLYAFVSQNYEQHVFDH